MPQVWVKNVRMLAILREPILRDLSVYNHMKSLWWDDAAARKSGETGLGSIEYVMCEYKNHQFPTYKQATACQLQDWSENCMAKGGGDTRAAYSTCSSQTGPPWRKSNRLANGVYLPQVEGFVSAFSRSQLMVLNFDSTLHRPADHIERVLTFLNLPSKPQLTTLPADNTLRFPGR